MEGDSFPLIVISTVVIGLAALFFVNSFLFKSNGEKSTFITKEVKGAKLLKKIAVSHDTTIFRFSTGSKNATLGLPIGKHIRIVCPAPSIRNEEGKWNGREDIESKRAEVERKYTPITLDSTASGHFDILVKIYRPNDKFVDGGKMSAYLDSLNVGDSVSVSGPYGMIEYLGNGLFKHVKSELPVKHVGMIAGGSGITPMYQICQSILLNPEDPTRISLIYANQTEEDILLRNELDALVAAHPTRFSVHYTLDRPPATGWTYSTGFVSEAMLRAHLPSPGKDSLVLLCGPPPMLKFACHANLDKIDWPVDMRLQF